MSDRSVFCTSVTRTLGLDPSALSWMAVERGGWRHTDVVVGEVLNDSRIPLELTNGRMTEAFRGDIVVGALGRRHATLEAVGNWEEVGEDLRLDVLTGGGLLGRLQSVSTLIPPMMRLAYLGHLDGPAGPRRLIDEAPRGRERVDLACPVVLVVGTSMAAGKTATCRVAVRHLARRGLRVVAAKLTGAGRYRDILSMGDAGADSIFDFVDAGLPSTVCPADEYRPLLRGLLERMTSCSPDVIVVEAGASPLEPYNGGLVLEELGSVACLVLAAGDPYAVVGIREAFDLKPDVVTGLATATVAGRELIGRLTALPAVNVLDPESRVSLEEILDARIVA